MHPITSISGEKVIQIPIAHSTIYLCQLSSGGSHWSLLMFSKQARKYFHFDSSSGMNNDPARKLASNMHSYLMSKMPIEDRYSLQSRQVPVAQQTNGYDCGVHLLCNAKAATR